MSPSTRDRGDPLNFFTFSDRSPHETRITGAMKDGPKWWRRLESQVRRHREPHRSIGTPRAWRVLVLVATAFGFGLVAGRGDTQTLSLNAGWNLIAFQVVPTNPSPAAVFGSLGGAFQRAFSYDAASGVWSTFGAGATTGETVTLPQMSEITLGKGYWIYMNQPVASWPVSGASPTLTPPVNFSPGWNMIGVPAGASSLSQPVNILAVLTASGLNFGPVLRWEQSLYTKFDPSGATVDDFTTFDPNRGYWVNIKGTSTFALQPKLLATTRADQDNAPYGNYPSYEDVVVSDSPTPLGPADQTTIRFFPGEESQVLALSNVGGGILLWQAVVSNAPWLRLSASQGVTTLENDVVTLSLDRSMLLPGRYQTMLTLETTAGSRTWKIIADVAPLAGDWRGVATINSVNGRHNAVPDIDLEVAFFEDPSNPGLLRGNIDSQNVLLWPVDVPLVGRRDDQNNFSFGGGFVLPPGDVNRPPYAQFNPSMEDVDWNCNGAFDAVNPYPFPIYRQVSMRAALATANVSDGYKIQGDYTETIYGMLRDPIILTGVFTLTRENPIPFTARRPVANVEAAAGTDPVVLKQRPVSQSAGPGQTVIPFAVETDLILSGLTIGFDLANVTPTNAKVTLQPPNGTALTLVDHRAVSTLVGLSFPDATKPKDDFSAFLATSPATKGTWKLIINNTGNEFGSVANVSFKLTGQPVFTVAGTVQGPAGQTTNTIGLPAQVFLDGLPFNAVTEADQNGRFSFPRVPGIPLNISASLPGYASIDPTSPGLSTTFTLPQYNTNCLSPAGLALAAAFRALPVTPVPAGVVDGFIGATEGTNGYVLQLASVGASLVDKVGLIATPFYGPAPLPVDFTIITESYYDGTAPLYYHYGDGSPEDVENTLFRTHTYAASSPTGYVADVTIKVQGLPDFKLPTSVYPMPSPGNSPYKFNFFSVAFTGGGSLPLNEAAAITGANDTNKPPALATLLQAQMCYTAAFDLDLAPAVGVGKRFDSDGFDPNRTITNSANWVGNFRGVKYTYAIPDGSDPGAWSLSAQCGDVIPSDTYRGYPLAGATGDCAGPRFAMTCNIGANIVPATADDVYIIAPSTGPIYGSNPDPLASVDADGLGATETFRLVTGPMAGFWNEGKQ